ncbi:MAG: STAS domain-containing protein [Acidobacteria bacterium]|nr:STAS domain-containing protein [Acidobacteriota bacterium]
MSLEIREREKDTVILLDIKGRLTVGDAVASLREHLTQLISSGKANIVLNLSGVDYIDSTGLGSMVICYTTAKKNGGMLKLLNLSRRNIELLVLTKLTTVFEVFDDEQSAINSYFPNREIKRFDILSFLEQQKKTGE